MNQGVDCRLRFVGPPFHGYRGMMAGSTGLEPAASAVTGQRSNQLNYDPALRINAIPQTQVR